MAPAVASGACLPRAAAPGARTRAHAHAHGCSYNRRSTIVPLLTHARTHCVPCRVPCTCLCRMHIPCTCLCRMHIPCTCLCRMPMCRCRCMCMCCECACACAVNVRVRAIYADDQRESERERGERETSCLPACGRRAVPRVGGARTPVPPARCCATPLVWTRAAAWCGGCCCSTRSSSMSGQATSWRSCGRCLA